MNGIDLPKEMATTKGQILGLLQRESLTVAQLCECLGVSRNAISIQLRQLEAEGLVRRVMRQERGGVGKPATWYEAAPGSEDISSKAYRAVLPTLLLALRERLGPDDLAALLEETGRRLARDAGLLPSADNERDVRAAMNVVDSLGANTEAVLVPNGIMIRNYSCPLGGAARREPCVCGMMAAFFSEATGRPVTDLCLRDGRLVCRYLIELDAARKARKAK